MNGRVYGAPMRMAVKSLVWYPKKAYDEGRLLQGAQVDPGARPGSPTRSRPSGTAPWCMGWESDQATGWVGTDWIEEYVLRMYGPDVYDQWVAHEIPFNDERIVKAYDEFGKLVKTKGNVLGGVKGILNTPFGDAMTPAFDTPAEVLPAPPGQLRDDLLPGQGAEEPRHRGRHLRLPAVRGRLRRPADPRRW